MIQTKTDKLKEQHTKISSKGYEKSRKKINVINKLKKVFLIFFFVFVCLICVGTAAGVYFLSQFTKDLPDFTKDFEKPFTGNSIMYDRNGKELYRLRSPYTDREVISDITEVPDIVKWSFIMAEDQKFYEHPGIDFQRILVAGSKALTNNFAGGASTIDQQVLKNSTLRNEASSGDQYTRKIKEVILALQLDKKYAKDDILKYYLNIVPIRSDVVGAKTGARKLFSKDLGQLTLGEATLLASLANNPVVLDPFSQSGDIYCNERTGEVVFAEALVKGEDGNPLEMDGKYQGIKGSVILKAPNYKCRQIYVLDQMSQRLDKINKDSMIVTTEDIEAARIAPLEFKRPVELKLAKQFVDYAVNDLENKEFILNGSGYTNTKLDESILREGELRIYTTLNLDYQNIAQNEIKNWVDGPNGIKSQVGIYNAAFGLMDIKSREILIMVGSKDPYATDSEGHDDQTGTNKFDPEVNVLNTIQNVGSSSKPFGYMAGFETGVLNPASFLPIMPVNINGWRPQNAEGFTMSYQFNSKVNLLRNALWMSWNTPAAQAADIVGVPAIKSIYERFGYDYVKDWETGNSIMIGAEVRPIDHINGFATIGENGIFRPKQSILMIQDKFGNILWKYDPNLNAKQVIDPRVTYLMSDILYNYGPYGTPLVKSLNGYYAYAKTGTSDAAKDLVEFGYTSELAFGMWIGNNDNSDVGTNQPYSHLRVQPAIANIMNQILPNYPNEKIKQPDGIVERAVCTVSGKLPNPTYPCPNTITEKFMADKLPAVDDTYSGEVTVCTDKPASDPTAKPIYKTARQTDIDYGYSKVTNWPYVRTIVPSHQQMFDNWSKQKQKTNALTCDTDYSKIEGQPAITVTSPLNGDSFVQGSQIHMNVSAAGFLGQVNDMKIYLDSTLVSTSLSSSIDVMYTIPISTVPGNHVIQVTATDMGGRSQNQVINIVVTARPIVTSSSTSSSSITNDAKIFTLVSQNSYTMLNSTVNPVTVIANVSPANGPYGDGVLNITGPGFSDTVNMNRSGSSFSANWTPPMGIIKTYTITPSYTSPNGIVSNASSITVIVN